MARRGILLINLGSPDSHSVEDVRRYLREFLMDGRVIDTPWLVRFALVNGMIIPRRAHQSAEAYASIWTEAGSPLVAISKNVCAALQKRVNLPVRLGMRYQNPSIEEAIRELRSAGVDQVLVIPLFPHYAMSSYETAVEKAKAVARAKAPGMTLKIVKPFFDHPSYIVALAASASEYLHDNVDHVLFSFHGLPERHLHKADKTGCHCLRVPQCCEIPSPTHATCYRAQCFKTVRAFAKETGLPQGSYSVAFQSRLGRDPWLQPYTDAEISRLAKLGVKRLAVICPAFVSDCLETLEEIGMRGRELFREAGGDELVLVPCLNEHPAWIAALERLVNENFGITEPDAEASVATAA
jgi:protoporphyrin/coproporphyrin ferrochelatase